MAQSENRSLQELKREAEQTRAGLTQTVEQLRSSVTETAQEIRERASPAAIKAEVSNYIRSRGEQLMDEMTVAARRNPLQAVAVGASVAYPLLRLARAVPVPVLMLGAGLFLAGSKTGRAATQKASDVMSDLADEAMKRGRELRDQVEESTEAVKAYASEKMDDLGGSFSNASQRVGGAARETGSRMSEAGSMMSSGSDQIRGAAQSAGASIADGAAQARQRAGHMADAAISATRSAAGDAIETGHSVIGAAKDAARNTAHVVREKAVNLTERTGATLSQTIERNPLLVAGVGLVVGGLIASAFPRSEMEDEIVAGASSAVRQRAQAATSQGIGAARQAVSSAYDEAARQAEEEGLDPEGLSRTAQDIGNRVRRVAEAAVTTAFEPSHEDHSQNRLGDKHHG